MNRALVILSVAAYNESPRRFT